VSSDTVSDSLPRDQRRLAFAILVVLGISIACYLVDVWLLQIVESRKTRDSNDEIALYLMVVRSILESLIAGSLAALILTLVYRWVSNWIDPGDRVEEVAATQITQRLLRNARDSRHYTFIGNTATFVTTAVLPVLTDAARTSSQMRAFTLYLVDPIDTATVESYKNYSDGVARQSSKVSDATLAAWVRPTEVISPQKVSDVVGKVLAAIYLASYGVSTHGLTGAIYLRRAFTPFRLDLSDREAVLTQESASESAVAFSARGHFYGWYQKECEALRAQCIHLDLTGLRDKLRLALVHPAESKAEIEQAMKRLLALLPHLSPLSSNQDAIAAAVSRVARPTHAYK
jgi:hypothetical protein